MWPDVFQENDIMTDWYCSTTVFKYFNFTCLQPKALHTGSLLVCKSHRCPAVTLAREAKVWGRSWCELAQVGSPLSSSLTPALTLHRDRKWRAQDKPRDWNLSEMCNIWCSLGLFCSLFKPCAYPTPTPTWTCPTAALRLHQQVVCNNQQLQQKVTYGRSDAKP